MAAIAFTPDPETFARTLVRGVILDAETSTPIVILEESGGGRYLPIWIGLFEAEAISLALNRAVTARPLTHELLRSTIETLGATLLRIEVHAVERGTFLARLILAFENRILEVDARPSDAIGLALRAGAEIWTARAVLEAAGVSESSASVEPEEKLREWLARARPEELGKYSM